MKQRGGVFNVPSNCRRRKTTSGGRGRQRFYGLLERLETRLAPTIGFDLDAGLLRVLGDEAGPRNDTIAMTITDHDFIVVTLNGLPHSSDPSSAQFDSRLAGARAGSVRAINLVAGNGNDELRLSDGFGAASGQITLHGGRGRDLLVGGDAADSLVGGPGRDTLRGGPGDDVLRGMRGADRLEGDAGRDRLNGGRGDDSLDAGADDDTVLGQDGDDTVLGGDGADSLDGGVGLDRVVQGGDFDQVLTDALLTGLGPDVLAGIELASLIGGPGANLLDARQFTAGAVSLEGAAGNDLLLGGSGNDTLNGGDGDDTFAAGPGDDTLDGGPGTDLVTQVVDADQTLSDTLLTGEGRDQLVDVEAASLAGGPGDNVIRAVNTVCGNAFTRGPVTLLGGAGNDGLISGSGSDLVVGGLGDDIVSNECAGGQDTLLGGEGNDRLISGPDPSFGGSGGANFLDAGPGNDELRAFGSNDTLLGGPGADSFDSRCGVEFVSDLNADEGDVNAGCDPGPL